MIYFLKGDRNEVLKKLRDKDKEMERLKEELANYKKVSQNAHSPVIQVESSLLNSMKIENINP